MNLRDNASAGSTPRRLRPWHVRKSPAREPGDLLYHPYRRHVSSAERYKTDFNMTRGNALPLHEMVVTYLNSPLFVQQAGST